MDTLRELSRLHTKLMKQGTLTYGEQSLLITMAIQAEEIRTQIESLKYIDPSFMGRA